MRLSVRGGSVLEHRANLDVRRLGSSRQRESVEHDRRDVLWLHQPLGSMQPFPPSLDLVLPGRRRSAGIDAHYPDAVRIDLCTQAVRDRLDRMLRRGELTGVRLCG
jgi:hypothetical protein